MPDTITTEFLALRDRYIASCFTKLNPVQQQAVFTTEGPLLILAAFTQAPAKPEQPG